MNRIALALLRGGIVALAAVFLGWFVFTLQGCAESPAPELSPGLTAPPPSNGGPGPQLSRPSRSTPIELSDDDALLAVANPDNDSVTVFDAPLLSTRAILAMPAGSMPVSVALHPDGQTMFVALRKQQRLARGERLRGELFPHVDELAGGGGR